MRTSDIADGMGIDYAPAHDVHLVTVIPLRPNPRQRGQPHVSSPGARRLAEVFTAETNLMRDERPCARKCMKCGLWKHHSRYRLKTAGTSTVSRFSSLCVDYEQKLRNEKKNVDRPLTIIRQRATTTASKMGESVEFVWTQMNYRALVPVARALMTSEGLCQNCG